jgi:hypothetical protein
VKVTFVSESASRRGMVVCAVGPFWGRAMRVAWMIRGMVWL